MSIELIIATFENDENRAEEVLKNAKALENYQKAFKIAEKNHSKLRALYLNNIGTSYKKLDRFSKALTYFKKSLLVSTEEKDDFRRCIGLINIGDVYGKIGAYDKGLSYLFKAQELNESINYKLLE